MNSDNVKTNVEKLNAIFNLKHSKEIEAHIKIFGNKPCPSIYKDEDGILHWLNRKERRKLMKRKNKN